MNIVMSSVGTFCPHPSHIIIIRNCLATTGKIKEPRCLDHSGGTEFGRRGLELRNWRDRLLFWRRMTVKIAVVTKKKGPVT